MPFTRKYYIADTHFGNASIISNCRRPFVNTELMTEYMVSRWNEVASDNDLVYHLGDFALGLQDAARVMSIFNRLRGRKILITGNHDLRRGELHPTLAALAWDRPPVAALETTDGGNRVYLSHYAHRSWPAAHYGSYHFYGHSHGNLQSCGRSRDVGVDLLDVDFTPRSFHELTKDMA
ncbi:hypothetical protein ELI48_02320 [Rhizobium ruizarguesonis]|uniref:metallophosphoesterase family protein n=1 Tax=Rhizobium ruizarguesonis TaxID=2081791 RepID=UPI0010323F29|nr:metallophosphoesterase family protein [Rhizobium ruizarguesonis]TAU25116.1 hypothetical protein ELI48_02320 [Rhizobium ruizarguesonis]TAU66758.1 hypothetical protein ELI45_02140 [Rhizobium ruizarguesonis]TAW08512.1 hypothetical protein ELI26_02310 [Rhizobium ruizarguesonis]